MNFGKSISTCFRSKYADFSGRASRSEYWFWQLFNILCLGALCCLSGWIFRANGGVNEGGTRLQEVWTLTLSLIPAWLWILITIIPSVAVAVRRMHDSGNSGLWTILFFIPWGAEALTLAIWAGSGEPVGDAWWVILFGGMTAIGVAVIFILSILRTQPYRNRYGNIPEGVYPELPRDYVQ